MAPRRKDRFEKICFEVNTESRWYRAYRRVSLGDSRVVTYVLRLTEALMREVVKDIYLLAGAMRAYVDIKGNPDAGHLIVRTTDAFARELERRRNYELVHC